MPKVVDNLLVAGRCISTTHVAAGATRVMATCMAVGQAAGIAAALSIKGNKKPREVEVKALQDLLIKQDAILFNNQIKG